MKLIDVYAQEYTKKLEGMRKGDDPEVLHYQANWMLLNLLERLGYENVTKAYREARDRVGFDTHDKD